MNKFLDWWFKEEIKVSRFYFILSLVNSLLLITLTWLKWFGGDK